MILSLIDNMNIEVGRFTGFEDGNVPSNPSHHVVASVDPLAR